MSNRKMRNCPFCNSPVSATEPYLMFVEGLGKYTFSHYCHSLEDEQTLSVFIVGNTEDEVINDWNNTSAD